MVNDDITTECKCCECKHFELEVEGRGLFYVLLCNKFKELIGYPIYLGWGLDSNDITHCIKDDCDKFEKDDTIKDDEWWL